MEAELKRITTVIENAKPLLEQHEGLTAATKSTSKTKYAGQQTGKLSVIKKEAEQVSLTSIGTTFVNTVMNQFDLVEGKTHPPMELEIEDNINAANYVFNYG